jgi:hypothetical protein
MKLFLLSLFVFICALSFSSASALTSIYCQNVTLSQLTTCSMISGPVLLLPNFNSVEILDTDVGIYINELKNLGFVSGPTCEKAITLFLCAITFPSCTVLATNCLTKNCNYTYNYCSNPFYNNTFDYSLNNTCYDTVFVNGSVLQLTLPCRKLCSYAVSSCPGIDPNLIEEFDCEATVVEQGPLGQLIQEPLYPIENSGYRCTNYDAFIPASSSTHHSSNIKSDSAKSYHIGVTLLIATVLVHLFKR